MPKPTELRHYAVVDDSGSVGFVQSNIADDDRPSNYHEIPKAQWDKFTEDPEKLAHYIWQNNKPVYKQPPPDPNPPPVPVDPATQIFALDQKIEGLFRRIEALEKRVDRSPKIPKENKGAA